MLRSSSLFIAALASSLLACPTSGGHELTEADHGSTLELEVGETFVVELNVGPVKDSGDPTYRWVHRERLDTEVLRELSSEVPPRADKQRIEFQAFGPGEQRVKLEKEELPDPGELDRTNIITFELTVRVTGERLETIGSYLEGIELVGGFGTSLESGKHVRELLLEPTDLTTGKQDGKLYLASGGTLWRIDPSTELGEHVLLASLPANAQVTSAEQQSNGDLLLGLRIGGENVVGWIRSNGTWEELHRYSAKNALSRVRLSPTGSWGSADRQTVYVDGKLSSQGGEGALEFESDGSLRFASGQTGMRLAGKDRQGRLLFWEETFLASGLWELNVSPALGTVESLFSIDGREDFAQRWDFYPYVAGGSSGAGSWDPMIAAVAITADGSYWTYTVQLTDTGKFVMQPKPYGLYVRRP